MTDPGHGSRRSHAPLGEFGDVLVVLVVALLCLATFGVGLGIVVALVRLGWHLAGALT